MTDKDEKKKEDEKKKKESKESKEDKAAKEQKTKELTSEARKAFSMAERIQTQAEVLRTKLKKEGVKDDALALSVCAPKIRNGSAV